MEMKTERSLRAAEGGVAIPFCYAPRQQIQENPLFEEDCEPNLTAGFAMTTL
jgi:hypothetical protein